MYALRMYTIAFVLMAASLPLVSLGASNGLSAAWLAGFGVLILGALIPVVVRFAAEDPDVTL